MQILNKSSARIKRLIKINNITNLVLSILLITAIGIFFASVVITQLMEQGGQSVEHLNGSIHEGTKKISNIINSTNINNINVGGAVSGVQQTISGISSEIQNVLNICLKTFYYITLVICLILFVKLITSSLNIFTRCVVLFKIRMRYKFVYFISIFIDMIQIATIALLIVLFASVGFFEKANMVANIGFASKFFNTIREIMSTKVSSIGINIPAYNIITVFSLAGLLIVTDFLNIVLKWISLRKKCFKDNSKINFVEQKINENVQPNIVS